MAIDIGFELLKWQRELFADKTRFQVVVAGRRCGKTRFAAVKLLVKSLQCPDRLARVMYVAPTQAMATDLMWDLLVEIGKPVIEKTYISDNTIVLTNGVSLQIRGADKPDRLRGKKLFYAVLDEMKDMKDDVWELNIRPSLSDMKGGALIIGTPEPGESTFRSLFELGKSEEDPEWRSWHFTTYDNETIDKSELEAAKRSMSTMAFRQEYMASFDTNSADIFREEWFKYGPEPKGGDYYIAVDLAGFEDVSDPNKKKHLDETAIAVVKITDDGKWWVKKVDGFRKDVRETAVRILMAIRTYKPICVGIEKGSLMRAIMPYLSDLMNKNNLYVHIEPIATSGSTKKGSDAIANRVIYNLQGLFEHGRIIFSDDQDHDELKAQTLMFPSAKMHDERIDALSLDAYLHQTIYGDPDPVEEYEVLDEVVGF